MTDALQDIRLRTFDASPTTIILHAFPVVSVVSNDVFLYAFDASPTTIILRRMDELVGGASFPKQYLGLRVFYGAATHDLCLVDAGDAPSGMGATFHIQTSAGLFAAYLVDTGDANASNVRIKTTAGVKAIRLKT